MTELAVQPDVLARACGPGTGQRRKREGSLAKAEDETDWAGLLVKVRDHQDRAAFAQLFRHFAPRVKAFLMKSGAGAALAEECAQDVMATLWQKAHLFDPAHGRAWRPGSTPSPATGGSTRCARRAGPSRRNWTGVQSPSLIMAEVLETQQETERLGRALAALPAPQRTLIERAFYGDLSSQRDRRRDGASAGDDQIADSAGAGQAAPPDDVEGTK